MLSDSEDYESDRSENIKINKKFAEEFDKKERLKDLRRSKDLLENGDEEESESETEDEDAEELSPEVNLKIIQTINSLRKKDPRIYDSNTTWFEQKNNTDDNNEDENSVKDKKSKKKTFKDVIRTQLLETGADLASDDENKFSSNKLSYDEEQRKLRQEFLDSANQIDSDVNDDDDDMLIVKERSESEKIEEEKALQEALAEMKRLGENEADEDVKKSDQFLEQYITKKMWMEPKGSKNPFSEEGDEVDLEEDERVLEEIDQFESKYNFRFQEIQENQEDQSQAIQVQGYARNVAGSLRRVDTKRKEQREARLERKEKEKRQREAELRRLKNLKRQELQERLGLVKGTAGTSKLRIDEDFLDEEWDPEKHEALMASQYDDEYYKEDDDGFNPENADKILEEIDGGYDEDEGENNELVEEYENEEEIEGFSSKKKALEDELYKLDYEDVVGGVTCRFKYRQVEPEDYGLTAEDILLADDKELNQYISLKHLSTYRKDKKTNTAPEIMKKKRKKLRAAVKERLEKEAAEAEAIGKQLKGGKNADYIDKNSRKKNQTQVEVEDEVQEKVEETEKREENKNIEPEGGKRKRRRKKKSGQNEVNLNNNDEVSTSKEESENVGKEGVNEEKGENNELKSENSGKKRKRTKKKSNKSDVEDHAQKRMELYV